MRQLLAGVAVIAAASITGFVPLSAQAGSPPKSSLNSPIYIPVTIGTSFTTRAYPQAASRFAAAPVPNLDENAPVLRTLGPAQAEVAPSLFRRTSTYRGEGFTTGSSAESEQSRHIAPTPGVNLSMPLQ